MIHNKAKYGVQKLVYRGVNLFVTNCMDYYSEVYM